MELAGTLLMFEDKNIEMVGQVSYADIGNSALLIHSNFKFKNDLFACF